MTGKLIVVDGTDGSGKTTQVKLLFNYLKQKKVSVQTMDFPRYENVYGKIIKAILTSQWGQRLSPYLVALPFAMDRRAARKQIREWLREGKVVIVDRYATSSIAHQGAKLEGKKREKLMKWVENLEYGFNGLVKEDLVVFLSLPFQVSQQLIKQRLKKKGKRDLVDVDADYQRKVVEVYNQMAKKNKHWRAIKCVEAKEGLLTRREVHKRILRVLQEERII
jgi:dTMP kinase